MVKWRVYQEEAAAFFRSLGMEAQTDAEVVGVRGSHAVDVLVTSGRAGIAQKWIVECKCWSKKVDKLHVAALAEIVRDVGADRGVLLSEIGFQAGAIRMAQASNVTLTSLEDLRQNSAAELVELGLHECRTQLAHIHERIGRLRDSEARGPSGWVSSPKPGANMETIIRMLGFLGIGESALREAEVGRWPVLFGFDIKTDKGFRASNKNELLTGLRSVINQLERELAMQEQAVAEFRSGD